jgi:DNA/RNA endonuclease G (NUC1)
VLAVCAGVVLLSCTGEGPVSPRLSSHGASLLVATDPSSPRISEIHYDNTGTDAGEAIEVSGPAGMSLDGWSLVLYNGNGGAPYNTTTLSGTIPATCSARGVVVLNYPVNGIQNGDPDGVALVNASGTVIEYLSYEGTFAAVGGPANGLTSTDIAVREAGTEALGLSLQRNGAGVWSGPVASTFGVCNDNDGTPPAEVASITVSPATATVNQGATQQFAAKAFDASSHEIPGVAFTWSSDAPAIASVDAAGLATGLAPGDAHIIGAAPNGVTGSAALHVDPPAPPPPGSVKISEIHYDNVGTDAGEAIEIEGPAGFSLANWSVVLYNGNGGASYNARLLTGVIPATCDDRGVVVLTYPANGIQNGSPDGVALVNELGQVVEFLSYEGTFTATGGPALNMTSTDIGVSEDPDNSVAIGNSLQRDASGTWTGPTASTFGACNGGTEPPPPSASTIVINELMADPLHAAGGASFGEWFEVYNTGTQPVDMQGWTIASAGQPDHVISSSVVVGPGGFAVLGRGADITRNGGLTIDYNYFTGTATTIFLDVTDYLVLRDATGARVDSVRWTSGSTMAKGVTRALRDASIENANVDGSNWGYSTVSFGDGDFGTPHVANGPLSDTPPPTIAFTGRVASDPALPVDFEDQIFASLMNGNVVVPTTITWTSETPAIASINANGVIRALSAGTATFRATASDGTTARLSLPTRIAVASTTALYGGNAEFGEPADADASDDFIVRRPQYTLSYSNTRNTPNWVSYDLEATHFGAEDRCDCFTFDPALPASFTRYNTNDYTGAGAIAGFGIDRGHLARSFDRTSASFDNAMTFYFSNIIPQASDLNQGPWANMENDLGNFARFQNKEVYIIAGPAGNKGTVKNEGKIVIPASVWKVAVIMPRDQGLANIHDYRDLEVIAVIMPNVAGVRNVDWTTYKTTVDAVEALSRYDLLALLPDKVERAVESNTKPPLAALDGPYSGFEGGTLSLSADASVDPNGSIVSYEWTFGDGASGSGSSITHTFAQNGSYTVRLIVVDNDGLADTVTTSANIANVAPVVSAFAGATLVPHETYGASGTFSDPGADSWSATVNYGDGSGVGALSLSGKSFSLSHVYLSAGSFTVTVRVLDGDATTAQTQTVTVLTPQQAVNSWLLAVIDQAAAAGRISQGNANAVRSTLDAVTRQLDRGRPDVAASQLRDLRDQIAAWGNNGKLTVGDAAALLAAIDRLIASLTA